MKQQVELPFKYMFYKMLLKNYKQLLLTKMIGWASRPTQPILHLPVRLRAGSARKESLTSEPGSQRSWHEGPPSCLLDAETNTSESLLWAVLQ